MSLRACLGMLTRRSESCRGSAPPRQDSEAQTRSLASGNHGVVKVLLPLGGQSEHCAQLDWAAPGVSDVRVYVLVKEKKRSCVLR